MTRYLLSRLGQSLLVLWGAFTASFVLLYALPSDAISIKLSGASDTGSITPEQLAQIRQDYGFDRPLVVQYVDQLADLVRGDFGTSLTTGATVTSTLGSALPQTLVLSGLAIVVGTLVGLVLGSVSGYLPPRARELLLSLPPVGVSIPTFTVGLVLIHVVAFQWRLLPSAGNQGFESLVLPSLTLSLPVAAVVTQIFAKSLQGVLRQDYIATAVAKGAGRGRVHLRHAFRNAIGPTLTMTGVVTGNLLAGTVVVETIFSREGIGRTTVDAVNRQDLPVVQGVVLLSALTFILVNLAVDLVYPLIDRRITLVTARPTTSFEKEALA
jgi:peptide/nickel transport system permease protein